MIGYLVKGQDFDTGLPDTYRQTLFDFRNVGNTDS
jgi:UTP--glucose-1-phosphate uridylyltransferase